MNGDPLKIVQQGQPLEIPAAAYNAFITTANSFLGNRANGGALTGRGGFGTRILIKNISGVDVDRFGILGFNAPIIKPDDLAAFKNGLTMEGETPATADHWGKFAVCVEPILDEKLGNGVTDGLVVCKVDVQEEEHEFADIADGESGFLQSYPAGSARIMWKESGTGEKWAVLLLGNSPLPKIPDEAKNYSLTYIAANKTVEWVEITGNFSCS